MLAGRAAGCLCAAFRGPGSDALRAEIEGMLDADTSPFLPQISCPMLIVAGEKDGLLPPAHAREIHERVPSSHLVVLAEGAHFIPYQRPDEFARMVSDFLDRPRVVL
jgi:3-oxoadipate enol-lactonase